MSLTSAPVVPCSCAEGWKPEGWAYCAECYEGKIERLRADAARYQYLKTCCSYFYHESHNPPSPREFGIEWHWQDGTPERPDIDTLIDREIEEKRALYAADEDEGLSLTPADSRGEAS
jgi:hypothetical protein